MSNQEVLRKRLEDELKNVDAKLETCAKNLEQLKAQTEAHLKAVEQLKIQKLQLIGGIYTLNALAEQSAAPASEEAPAADQAAEAQEQALAESTDAE